MQMMTSHFYCQQKLVVFFVWTLKQSNYTTKNAVLFRELKNIIGTNSSSSIFFIMNEKLQILLSLCYCPQRSLIGLINFRQVSVCLFNVFDFGKDPITKLQLHRNHVRMTMKIHLSCYEITLVFLVVVQYETWFVYLFYI